MKARKLMVVLAVIAAAGCGRMRFVIEAVPAEDSITETEVQRDDGVTWSSAKIALIDVTGLLVDAQRSGLLVRGENPVARFTESLRKAAADAKVRAIIIRINSPGGAVTACDVMYEELLRFKDRTGKPVVIMMEGVAASGGYYLACAGDEIFAHPTTVTGSIGVIIQTFNFAEGMGKIGIRADAITSGPNKAMGSPFEPMPPEHRALLQGLVDEFYDGFVAIVEERRPNLSSEDLSWITDGRVITGRRAAEVGVIDRLGNLHDAYAAAKKRAQVLRARLVKYHRPLEDGGSAYGAAQVDSGGSLAKLVGLGSGQPGFYYLWDPLVW